VLCARCGVENPDDAAFCQKCGNQLMAAGTNTTNQGKDAIVPSEASGWTFAGFVPFGLFAFKHGLLWWGVIGILACIPSLGIVLWLIYWIYIGVNGKKLAWRHRRFESAQQFRDTMRAWNMWGIILLPVTIVLAYAILIAIALPNFTRIQQKAKEADTKAALQDVHSIDWSRGAREKHDLAGHSDKVLDLAFSPDEKHLAARSFGPTAITWEPADQGQDNPCCSAS
jgi:hypothetical protein